MAGIVQIGLGLLHADTKDFWAFAEPYGFINSTHLIGFHEPCNNPFLDTGGSVFESINSAKRTGFRNHAFIVIDDDHVVDACAGPVVGDKSLSQYLHDAIDGKTALYPQTQWEIKTWARLKDVKRCVGVTGLDEFKGTMIVERQSQPWATVELDNLMAKGANVYTKGPIPPQYTRLSSIIEGVQARWPGYTLVNTGGLAHRRLETSAAYVQWLLRNDTGFNIDLQIVTLSTDEDALSMMRTELSSFHATLSEVVMTSYPRYERGNCSVVGSGDLKFTLWVQGCLFVHLRLFADVPNGEEADDLPDMNKIGEFVGDSLKASSPNDNIPQWELWWSADRGNRYIVEGIPVKLLVGATLQIYVEVNAVFCVTLDSRLKICIACHDQGFTAHSGHATPADESVECVSFDPKYRMFELFTRKSGTTKISLACNHFRSFATVFQEVEVTIDAI